MASISSQILRHVHRELGLDLVLKGRDLYVPMPTHFVRGICIEQTPYKDSVYVRRLNATFFTEFPVVGMTYSPRIRPAPNRTYFEGSPPEIAQLIIAAIARDEIEKLLRRNPTIAEFLTMIETCGRVSDYSQFDRAACHALLGQREQAIDLVEQLEAELEPYKHRFDPGGSADKLLAQCGDLRGALRAGRDSSAELRRRCYENMRALRFEPAPLPESDACG